jgi:uncharacterized protein
MPGRSGGASNLPAAGSAPAFRLHLVTLGVDDSRAPARFYEALGMKRHMKETDGVAFFDAGGALSLYGRDALAKDAAHEIYARAPAA